jgi:hypothetical protein
MCCSFEHALNKCPVAATPDAACPICHAGKHHARKCDSYYGTYTPVKSVVQSSVSIPSAWKTPPTIRAENKPNVVYQQAKGNTTAPTDKHTRKQIHDLRTDQELA